MSATGEHWARPVGDMDLDRLRATVNGAVSPSIAALAKRIKDRWPSISTRARRDLRREQEELEAKEREAEAAAW